MLYTGIDYHKKYSVVSAQTLSRQRTEWEEIVRALLPYAFLMMEHGVDIRHVQEQFGHACLQMTPIYTHVSIRKLKEVHSQAHLGVSLARGGLAKRNAALQHCCMTTLTLSKRGSLTLPPELRRKMGLDKLRNPMVLVEEREGGLFLQPAVALPVRDLPKAQIKAWIARDEVEMKAFRAAKPKSK